MWTHFSSWIRGRTIGLVTRRRMSRLTARIMAIMLFPLAIFLVGLLSLDQYRTTLIQSEFVALERQGFTLARSLALAEAARDQRVARRQLSPETMAHLLPLVGLGSSLRARVFQPNGLLLADTARRRGLHPNVEIRRREKKNWWWHKWLDPMGEFTKFSGVDGSKRTYPTSGTWEHYSFQVGNVLFLMMSDINEPTQRPGRDLLGGNPGGVVSGETFEWWKNMVEANQDKIIVSTHHYMLKDTTVASGEWEGMRKDASGLWKSQTV